MRRFGPSRTEQLRLDVGLAQVRGDGARDGRLQFFRRDAPAARAMGDAVLDQIGADVVAVAPSVLAGMARPHLAAVGIEQPAGERARVRAARRSIPLALDGKTLLHRVPQALVDDGVVLSGCTVPLCLILPMKIGLASMA